MNIFVTDPLASASAQVLDDKRCIKMILESAQLLSGAIILKGGVGTYRVTHKNHPCAVWARENESNYLWLVRHFQSLCREYTRRFNKIHACEKMIHGFMSQSHLMPKGTITPFKNCTIFKDVDDTYLAYRLALTEKWMKDLRPPKWTNAEQPYWFQDVKDLDE